jgi:S-DNA-T family DNA segregation ATPase FtsK/SpoIIIE
VDACDECQYSYDSETTATIPSKIRTLGGRYTAPLSRFLPGERGPDLVRAHPVTGAWSALECACHVRDLLEVMQRRVAKTLAEDLPTFEPMRRDERVLELAYNEQDPVVVAAAVVANAAGLAGSFEALTGPEWDRTGIYGYPEAAERSLLWMGQHTIHEMHHHLLDVGRTLRAARGR